MEADGVKILSFQQAQEKARDWFKQLAQGTPDRTSPYTLAQATYVQDNAGRTVSYTYNTGGYFGSVTDANGGVTKWLANGTFMLSSPASYRSRAALVSISAPTRLILRCSRRDFGARAWRWAKCALAEVARGPVIRPETNAALCKFSTAAL